MPGRFARAMFIDSERCTWWRRHAYALARGARVHVQRHNQGDATGERCKQIVQFQVANVRLTAIQAVITAVTANRVCNNAVNASFQLVRKM